MDAYTISYKLRLVFGLIIHYLGLTIKYLLFILAFFQYG